MFVFSGVNTWTNITPQHTVYVMTKGAVEQATRSLCKALGLKGITVNTIAPEATATDLLLVGKRDEALSGIAALR
jgi:3-oxoacyl-[acyl-carrier protein] reductase